MKRYVVVGGIVALGAFAAVWALFLRHKVYWGEATHISTYGCRELRLVDAPELGYNRKKVVCIDPFEYEIGTIAFTYWLGEDRVDAYCFGLKGENLYLVMAKPDSSVVIASLPRVLQ